MLRTKAVKRLFSAIMDSWAERRPGERIDPELCGIIKQHLNYTFVAGRDSVAIPILEALRKEDQKRRSDGTKECRTSITYIRNFVI